MPPMPADVVDVTPRRLRGDEWPALRALRLRGLQANPEAFCASLDVESAFDDAVWQQRAADGAAGVAVVTFVVDGDDDSGEHALSAMAVGVLVDDERARVWRVDGLWVAPERRRQGCADALVHRILAHARDNDADVVTTEVRAENTAALRFFERLGFAFAPAVTFSGRAQRTGQLPLANMASPSTPTAS